MKLVYNKKSNDPFYYIQHGVRVGDKVKTVTIKKLGRHSELAKSYDDPLAYALSELEKCQKEYNSSQKLEKGKKLSKESINVCKSNTLNIGYIYLQKIYSDLKLKDFFKDNSLDRKFLFDPNEINRFLIFDRFLEPESKLASVKNLHKFYEKPKFTHQQVLRFMDFLAENYDEYLAHLFKASNNIVDRDTSICYYDCTNYFFETEEADVYIDDTTGEEIKGLKQFGPCKENRPNPIVEMGLFMDKDGIPLSMGIFPGNENEQKTVSKVETKMLKTLKNKKIIYCADAGLGSSSIRLYNDMNNRAFIVTQSIKKLSEDLQNKVFKDEGYKLLSSDKEIKLKQMQTFDKNNEENLSLYNDNAYKEIYVDSMVDLGLFEEKTLKNGKTKKVKSKGTLYQKVIITYSRKTAEYQKHIRNKQIERAKYLIKKGVDDVRKGPNDIARFITKKDKTKNEYILDEEKIAYEEKFDGFYAIATNLITDKAQDIIRISSERNKIEECFRVLKTNFDARPVYHRLDNRIVAHFMICYSTLLIYRLLEKKLKEKEYKFTIDEIIYSLRNIAVCFNGTKYIPLYNYGEILDALNDITGIDLNADFFMPSYLNKNFKKISN